jgi:hypothetical protein
VSAFGRSQRVEQISAPRYAQAMYRSTESADGYLFAQMHDDTWSVWFPGAACASLRGLTQTEAERYIP